MKKVKGLRKRIVAMLMSGMLAAGSVPGVVLASENQTDIGRNSEIAAEVPEGADLEEVPEGADLKEVPEETSSEGLPAEEYSEDTAVQGEETVTSYTITLDANGGYFEREWDDTLGETVEQAEVVEKRIPVGGTVAAFPVCADQDGQTMLFAGWSLERDGELVTTGDEEYAPVDNCTLYAVWQKDETTSSVDVDDASQGYTDSQYVENADENSEQTDSGHESAESGIAEDAESEAGEDGAIEESESEIPDQNVDTGNKEGFENNTVGADDNSFSEESKNAEQSEDTVLLDESVPEVLEGEKPAAEEISAAGESGQFRYDIEDDKAMIRGRVPDVYYDEHGDYDHEDNLAVVHLTIPEEINGYPVTYIEGFSDCENLQSVTLPESLEEIGMKAFEGCLHLKQITFPSTLKRVCAGAFKNTGLTSVTIPAGTQTWEYVADNNYLPGVFDGCDSLSTITFEEGMTDISRGWCWGCTGLQNIQFPSTVKTIGYRAFADCSRLTSVVIPEGVTFIDSSAFENCVSLSSVSLASTLERIENGAFKNTGLTSVRIPAGCDSGQYTAYYRNLPYYPGVFEDCGKLSEVWFEDGTETVTRGWFFRCPGLETVHLPSTVKGIDFRAFADCENLKDVELPEGLEYIDEQVFIGCSSLAGVDLPSSLDYVGEGAFAETGLTEVTIPAGADTDRYHGYDIGVFEDCDKLRTVRFEEGMTRIGQGWCTGCTGLETIVFPSTLTEIFYAFEYCKNLSAINIPEGVKTIGDCSFKGCEKLTSVNFPSTLECIDWHAFEDCTSLKAITVPAAVSEVNDYAFAGCTSLEIFRSGGKLERLRGSAFERCTGLKEIHLPEKLSLIGESAFKDCVALADIYYGGTKEGWNKIDIREDNAPLSAAKLHPAKVIYKVTFNANGGTVKSGSKTVKTLSKNYSSKTAIGTLPTPSRNYYLFLGWYTAKTGGTKISKSTKVIKSVTYYARWVKCDIKKASITVKNATWTGKALKPEVTVKFNGKTLQNNKDYTVKCKNNVEPGKTAKAVIKGKGQYAQSSGTVTKNFTINKRSQNPGLSTKITRNTASLGKTFTLKPVIKEKAKVTYTVKNQKIAAPVQGKANTFKTKAAGKTIISVKISGTKHYKNQTVDITLIQCGKQDISLTSSLLKKTDKSNEFSMRGTTAPVSLGISVRGGAHYTTSIQNVTGAGGTISGNMISVPYSGKVKVTVKANKTEVYNALTETFTINVLSVAAGRTDLDSDWKIAQNADGSYTLLKYVGRKTEITVPESVKAGLQVNFVSAIGQSAFEGTSVQKVFMKSSQLKTIGPKAFRNVKTLTEVHLPANLTSLGAQAFEGCSKLKDIYLPAKLTVIPAKALKGCTGLKTLMIPANVTSIGEEAFSGCKNISELRMTSGVKTVSAKAFYGWTGIKKIYYGGSKKQLSNLVKKNTGNEAVLAAEIISYSEGLNVPSVSSISDTELFSQYTDYLYNRNFFHMTDRLYDEMHGYMASYSPADVWRASFKQATSKGVGYCLKAIISDAAGLGWIDDPAKKQLAMELILAVEDAPDYGEKFDEAYDEYVEEIEADDFVLFHDLIDEYRDAPDEIFSDGDTRYLFARKLANFFDETGNSRADASQWNEVLKAIGANWNMITKCMGYGEQASEQADCLIDFIFLCITLQDISETTVSMLLDEVPEDSILHEGLLMVKEQVDQPLASFIADYIKEDVLNRLSKVVIKDGIRLLDQVMKTKGYGAGTMVAIGSEFWKCAGNIVGTGVDFEAMNKGWISVANTSTLKASVGKQIGTMREASQNGNPPSASQISQFKLTMTAYLQSLIQTGKNVASNIDDKNEKARMNALVERYKNALNYRSYINSCKQNVLGN